ncbi:NUDIX domain-containing protein [Streptomyces sp. NPDC052042]|uniref:NUDIX domain-containing protein n=1 Tax=Streptomyces sp. NPDC052042 TaxID=3365683 RepID=UPI0037D7293F
MIRTLSSTTAYSNPWMTVLEDQVVHPSGHEGIYGYVDKPDFALIIPRTDTGFWLIEEFRYPVRARRWSFPQGSWPSGVSGTADDLARAELAEETGLSADRLEWLGRLDTAHGMTNQGTQVFVAEGLHAGEPNREKTERDMVHRHVTDAELTRMIQEGRFVDSASLASYLLYLHQTGSHCGDDGGARHV